MKVNVIVFDLDDTLYDEIDFVLSGFREVSLYFANKYKLSQEDIFQDMISILNSQGRGKVFNQVLLNHNIYTKFNVKKALTIYRLHLPNIALKVEIINLIKYYQNKRIPLYLVTDGNKIVQKNKVEALKLKCFFDKIFITHRYGVQYSKPSPYCFKKISNLTCIDNSQIVYIGDNINKDFVGIKPLGFKTIRIKNGMFKDCIKAKEFEADIVISNLTEIINILEV